ncbi:MAG: GTPase domain-containing protein [Bacteroidales bacterium]|nr:GTPase domain-containing protein [Bacteroidales bacterium]
MAKVNLENKDKELQKVLKESAKAAEQGYKDASKYMKDIRRSVESAGKIISSCKRELEKYNVNDGNLVSKVQEQLLKVQTGFSSECDETERNLQIKKQQTSTFNITLFGRTMTGKSTLMEILTHGDGKSMGHGGQRTTRDIRTYTWKGMTITDVPGVEAYDGKDDEIIAEASAIYADLIIFLITGGQPEGTEADWLVKLKKKDKPMVCICNYKESINDEHKLRRFLSSEERLAEKMNFDELIEQFNKFIQTELPNEKVKFLVTHLLAKFYSQQPQYKEKSKQLEYFSRFGYVENAIINEIVHNGKFYRQKCFLSIIDVPLYEQSVALFDFSTSSYNQSLVVKDKIKAFSSWQKDFNYSYYNDMHSDIDAIFVQLANKIDGFAEDHAEDRNPGDAWNQLVERFDINGKLEKSIQKIYKKCETDIQNIFRDLQQEMNFSFRFNAKFNGDFSITNWKKVNGRISATLGVVGAITGWILGLSNPVGWIITGLGALFGIFRRFSDSREEKLRENRWRITNKLREQVDAMKKKAHGAATKWYHENINDGIQSIAYSRLRMMSSSMLTLTNSERELALGYTKNHVRVSTEIIMNVMKEINAPQKYIENIIKVARIPSKKIVIVMNNISIPYAIKTEIARKIGNNEIVDAYKSNIGIPEEYQVRKLFSYFKIKTSVFVKNIEDNGHLVAFIQNKDYTQEEKDNIILIQQILNIHIIQRNNEN